MKNRPKVPESVAAELAFRIDLRCCVCEWTGDLPPRAKNGQIHHLDGDPANNDLANLAWMCLDHHEDAGRRGRASRSLSAGTIRRYRSLLERRMARQRSQATRERSRSHRRAFFEAMDAQVVIEVHRADAVLGHHDWKAVEVALSRQLIFPEEIGFEPRRAILHLLEGLAQQARFGMPARVAELVKATAREILPLNMLDGRRRRPTRQEVELLTSAGHIGRSLAYDGALKLESMWVAVEGCELLWRLLSYAVQQRHARLKELAARSFAGALDGAKRSGNPAFVALVETARRHGAARGRFQPDYPRDVIDALE